MKDKFLKQEIAKDDGWVPLTTILRFNRVLALTKDVNVILSAFKENPSELIEVLAFASLPKHTIETTFFIFNVFVG